MRAMVLEKPKQRLEERELPVPDPRPGEILVKVNACAVCRTDLHVVDGELADPRLPIIPGHEIVGIVERVGAEVEDFSCGDRLCIPWLGGTCQSCFYCNNDMENLCEDPMFTGYTQNGGFAEYTTASARFCFRAPPEYSDVELAPLLCAGLIGWRCYKFANVGKRIGIYGFGAAAHIVAQVARKDSKELFAFTRPGDKEAQEFARQLGACWAGGSDQNPPELLDSAIIFAPVGSLLPAALRSVRKGGTVVCGGIYMSDIPSLPYDLLWGERVVRSVANLTRADAVEFLKLAPAVPVRTRTHEYKLREAQKALDDLRGGTFTGAAVLVP